MRLPAFSLLLHLASIVSLCAAQNIAKLQQTLAAHGISAVYKTSGNFKTLSEACESYILFYGVKKRSCSTVNRRFSVVPVGIAFPTTVAQVSAAVAAGSAQKLEVVARSGGVRASRFRRVVAHPSLTPHLGAIAALIHC